MNSGKSLLGGRDLKSGRSRRQSPCLGQGHISALLLNEIHSEGLADSWSLINSKVDDAKRLAGVSAPAGGGGDALPAFLPCNSSISGLCVRSKCALLLLISFCGLQNHLRLETFNTKGNFSWYYYKPTQKAISLLHKGGCCFTRGGLWTVANSNMWWSHTPLAL